MSYTEEELRDTTRKFIDMLSGKNMCEKNCERSFPRDQHLIVVNLFRGEKNNFQELLTKGSLKLIIKLLKMVLIHFAWIF